MGIGVWQLVLILAIVILLFGAGKLPRLMGDVAKGIKAFKSGMKDDEVEQAKGPAQIAGDGKADATVERTADKEKGAA